MLAGQVAIPSSVSGVTTAPSNMPTSTKHNRASTCGTFIGRPMSATTATASIEPETRPAGNPISVKMTPPAVAISSVSAVWRSSRGAGKEGGIDRSRKLRLHAAQGRVVGRRPLWSMINAVCTSPRQMIAIEIIPGFRAARS